MSVGCQSLFYPFLLSFLFFRALAFSQFLFFATFFFWRLFSSHPTLLPLRPLQHDLPTPLLAIFPPLPCGYQQRQSLSPSVQITHSSGNCGNQVKVQTKQYRAFVSILAIQSIIMFLIRHLFSILLLKCLCLESVAFNLKCPRCSAAPYLNGKRNPLKISQDPPTHICCVTLA